jgi:hypothetical protein
VVERAIRPIALNRNHAQPSTMRSAGMGGIANGL